jgi:hypothetical protein
MLSQVVYGLPKGKCIGRIGTIEDHKGYMKEGQ